MLRERFNISISSMPWIYVTGRTLETKVAIALTQALLQCQLTSIKEGAGFNFQFLDSCFILQLLQCQILEVLKDRTLLLRRKMLSKLLFQPNLFCLIYGR